MQVDAIMALRAELMELTEKLRRAEADRTQMETDISGLRSQVTGGTGLLPCRQHVVDF